MVYTNVILNEVKNLCTSTLCLQILRHYVPLNDNYKDKSI